MRDDNVFFAEKTQKELEFKDHMAVSKNGRPRYKPQYKSLHIFMLIVGTSNKVSLILGNHNLGCASPSTVLGAVLRAGARCWHKGDALFSLTSSEPSLQN